MALDRAQRVALWGGGGAVLLMLLFPPWRFDVVVKQSLAPPYEYQWTDQREVRDTEVLETTGYRFLLAPPHVLDEASRAYKPTVDFSRLATQCLVVVAISAGVVAFLSERRRARADDFPADESPPGPSAP